MRHFSHLVPLVLLAAVVPATAASAAGSVPGRPETSIGHDASWRQDGGDAGRSGHQRVVRDLDAAAAPRLEQLWTAPATRPDEQVGGAVVVDGTLLRASGGPTGQIRRYDAVTGHDLGVLVEEPGRRFGQLAAVDDVVLVESGGTGAAGRHLSGYRMDGRQRWDVVLPDAVTGGYTVGDGLIVRSSGAVLSAYRMTDGGVAWTAPLDGEPGFHPPVVQDGLVLQATEGKGAAALLAFDERTGARAWKRPVGGPEIIAAGGYVHTVGADAVCSYDVADGRQRWCDTTALTRPLHATVSDSMLFVIDGAGRLAAFGVGDGAVLWRSTYGLGWETDTSYWSPVNGGGVLYAVAYHFGIVAGEATHRIELIAADAATGALLTRLELDFDSLQGAEPLLLSGDHVYFAAPQRLFAFGVPAGYGR